MFCTHFSLKQEYLCFDTSLMRKTLYIYFTELEIDPSLHENVIALLKEEEKEFPLCDIKFPVRTLFN